MLGKKEKATESEMRTFAERKGDTFIMNDFDQNQDGIFLKVGKPKGFSGTIEGWIVKDNAIRGRHSNVKGRRGISIMCRRAEERLPLDGLVIANNQLSHLDSGIWMKANQAPIFSKPVPTIEPPRPR